MFGWNAFNTLLYEKLSTDSIYVQEKNDYVQNVANGQTSTSNEIHFIVTHASCKLNILHKTITRQINEKSNDIFWCN